MWGLSIAQRRPPPPHLGIGEGFLRRRPRSGSGRQCVMCVGRGGGRLPRGCSNKRQVNNMKRKVFGGMCWVQDWNWSWWQKVGKCRHRVVSLPALLGLPLRPRGSQPLGQQGPPIIHCPPHGRSHLCSAVSPGMWTAEDNFSRSRKIKTIKAPALRIIVGVGVEIQRAKVKNQSDASNHGHRRVAPTS